MVMNIVPTHIYPEHTLNQIIAAVPETLPVLHRFGLDTCCGGGLTLKTAVTRHHLALETVLAALREVEPRP
jgi:iron-sulfur cluster repair protein YtfE (RIC family)